MEMPPCEIERCQAIGVRENLSVQARYRPEAVLNFSGVGQDVTARSFRRRIG